MYGITPVHKMASAWICVSGCKVRFSGSPEHDSDPGGDGYGGEAGKGRGWSRRGRSNPAGDPAPKGHRGASVLEVRPPSVPTAGGDDRGPAPKLEDGAQREDTVPHPCPIPVASASALASPRGEDPAVLPGSLLIPPAVHLRSGRRAAHPRIRSSAGGAARFSRMPQENRAEPLQRIPEL